jgi:hypothetical protein
MSSGRSDWTQGLRVIQRQSLACVLGQGKLAAIGGNGQPMLTWPDVIDSPGPQIPKPDFDGAILKKNLFVVQKLDTIQGTVLQDPGLNGFTEVWLNLPLEQIAIRHGQ